MTTLPTPTEIAGRAGRYLLQYLHSVTDVPWAIESHPIGTAFPITNANDEPRAYLCLVVPTDDPELRMIGATVAASLALLLAAEPSGHSYADARSDTRSLTASLPLDGRLFAHFQPIIELASGHVVAVETFARLQSGNAILLPESFIEAVSTPAAMLALFDQMLVSALQFLSRERTRLPHLSATVKLDFAAVPSDGLASLIEARLDEYGIAGEWLSIELVERGPFSLQSTVIDELWRVTSLGVQFVLADIENCERMIRSLPGVAIAGTKLSRRHITKVTENSPEAANIRDLIERTNAAGIEVIADGVETRQQTERLLSLGCRFGQGYLFAVPQAADSLTDVLDVPLVGAR